MKRNNHNTTPKKKKSHVKKIIAWLHLYPSLAASVILVFVCLTGTIIVYADEIIDYCNQDALYVPEVKDERLPLEQLRENIINSFPDRYPPSYAVLYKDPERSVRFNQYSKTEGLRLVFIDPYTGKILKDDGAINFFFVTAHLHESLLLGKTGQWIIDIATIIFLIGLITGIVLWWPSKFNKANLNRSFKIKFKSSFKRLNYDLHNVIGFYSLSIVLVLTVTGLLIAFPQVAEFTIGMLGGEKSPQIEKYAQPFTEGREFAPLNNAIDTAFREDKDASTIQILFPWKGNAQYVGLVTASHVGLKSHDGDIRFIDKYTAKRIDMPESILLHERIENVFWQFHMGTWLGWFGKLVTFIGGLIATSLPVTGFIIWWGRRKKKGRRKTLQTN